MGEEVEVPPKEHGCQGGPVTREGRRGMNKDDLKRACLEAEELANTEGSQKAESALAALADANPTRSEPRVSLAKLHRWLALRDAPRTVDRAELLAARRFLLAAVELGGPPEVQTLALLQDTTHDLAMHEEQARFFIDLARRDPRPHVQLQSLSWASIALECRGKELAAEGKQSAAAACYEEAVARHRDALDAWSEAPVEMRLSCPVHGGSHTVDAYAEAGRHAEWIAFAEAELGSAGGQALPVASRIEYFVQASDMAARGGLYSEAVRLSKRALGEWETAASGGIERKTQLRVEILGQLLLAHKGQGNLDGKEEAAREIQCILSDLEKAKAGNLDDLKVCYNLASRTFVVAEEWELAVQTAKRATEIWDFGPNYAFLAAALWVGFRDRSGALEALRNAARDARLSGKGMCRDLRDDFLRSEHFADVREDPEFLSAVEVYGVLD
jgi:tetratricopeptide (TPR) repeat protein